jgi:glycosyltransferase involved in cell wall biosynthesis
MTRRRLGIIVTHPIQYQVPLYRYMAACSTIEPVVFFLTEHGLAESFDPGFGRAIKYDVPLLGGYEYQVVPNYSLRPSSPVHGGPFNPSLPKLIRRSHVDALLVHGYNCVSHWLAYGTAVCSHIPYLLRGEARPDPTDRNSAKLIVKRALIRPLVRRAGACLAIGAENRQFYRSYGAHPDRIFFAPYSADTDRFAESGATGRARRSIMLESLGLEPNFPVILFAAKLQPWKRPADVVMAVDRLETSANLIVIGDGPLRPDMEQLAARRPWMRTLGFVNQQEIAEWYGATDLFVLPSSREPWGVAVNEAMAAGAIPVVSDAVGCAADLVTPDVGWVYPAGDINALSSAIAAALQMANLSGLRSAAQRRSAQFGIAATARGIEAAVAAVLSQ